MKNAVVWVLILAWCSAAGEMTGIVSFQDSEVLFGSRAGYSRISLSGCTSFGSPGEPLLPVKPVTLVLPSGACNVTVFAEAVSADTVSVSGTVQPVAVPRPFSAAASVPEKISENPAVYTSDSFWPGKAAVNIRTGNKGGFTLVSFLVYPVQYNPVSRELQVADTVEYTVRWENGISACVSRGQIRSAAAQLAGWIDNPQDLTACEPAISGEDSLDMLVITTGDYSDPFTVFTSFKNTQGIQTELVYVSDILASSSGYDDPEKIRNYIIDRYNADGLKYVLLAGDQTVVPVRNINLMCEGYGDIAPADLYYSDLDGTWDASGDHDYGQTDDDLDLYSDVAVGRALFGNAYDAALFVDRTIMYETEPPSGDWRSTAMLCGAGLFPGYTGAKVCDSIAVQLPDHWIVNRAYETARSDDGYTTHIDVINAGTNWNHYAGHGDTSGIYWMGSPSSMMTNSIAQSLTNGYMAGIHHSIACYPGAFHMNESCAEALWHNCNGGAVSVMFNTSYGWEGNLPEMGISEWMCVYITEEVFQLGNELIGEAFATAKDRRVPLWSGGYDRELYCLMDWHGFHDPTLVPAGWGAGIEESPETGAGTAGLQLIGPSSNPSVCGASVHFNVLMPPGPGRLDVFDVTGRPVWRSILSGSGQVAWNTGADGILPGVYFARLEQNGVSCAVRVILTR